MKPNKENIVTLLDWRNWFDATWEDLHVELAYYLHSDQWERLYHCSARLCQDGRVIVLKSYSTIVAAFDKLTHRLYINGYYSATTNQHVAKFKRWLREKGFEVHYWFNRSPNSRLVVGASMEYTNGEYKLYQRTGLTLVKHSGTQHIVPLDYLKDW